MKKVIPKFRHEGEKARFWGTYSPLDYPDKFSEVKEPFGFAPSLLKKHTHFGTHKGKGRFPDDKILIFKAGLNFALWT